MRCSRDGSPSEDVDDDAESDAEAEPEPEGDSHRRVSSDDADAAADDADADADAAAANCSFVATAFLAVVAADVRADPGVAATTNRAAAIPAFNFDFNDDPPAVPGRAGECRRNASSAAPAADEPDNNDEFAADDDIGARPDARCAREEATDGGVRNDDDDDEEDADGVARGVAPPLIGVAANNDPRGLIAGVLLFVVACAPTAPLMLVLVLVDESGAFDAPLAANVM